MGTTLILPASSLRHSKFSSLLSCAAPFFFFFFFFFVSFFFSFFFPCLRACPRRWRRSRLLSSLSCVLKLSALARPRRFSPDPGAGDNRRNPRGAAWDRRSPRWPPDEVKYVSPLARGLLEADDSRAKASSPPSSRP